MASKKNNYRQLWRKNVFSGFAWSLGVTLGFAFISTFLVASLSVAGGVPLIGDFIATIVQATNESLLTRTPLGP